MDTFVVRVYRSKQDDPPEVTGLRGVVEEVATGYRATFHDTGELLAILIRGHRPQPDVAPGTIGY